MDEKTLVILWVTTLLTFLESLALILGMDGQFFVVMVGLISGMAGYEIKSKISLRGVFK